MRNDTPPPYFEQYTFEPPATAKPAAPTAVLGTQVAPPYGSHNVVRSWMTMSPLDCRVDAFCGGEKVMPSKP